MFGRRDFQTEGTACAKALSGNVSGVSEGSQGDEHGWRESNGGDSGQG
jgi:hypothetical protein